MGHVSQLMPIQLVAQVQLPAEFEVKEYAAPCASLEPTVLPYAPTTTSEPEIATEVPK